MMRQRLLFQTIALTLVLLLTIGCGALQELSGTPTPALTSTPTATPAPTLTPTSTPNPFAGLRPPGARARLGRGSISEVALSPDGSMLAVASSIGVWLYDAQTLRELRLLVGHTRRVSSVAFSPDGRMLASGSGASTLLDTLTSTETDASRVILWDVESGKRLRTLEGHAAGATSVAFSPGGRTLASGSYGDDTVILWDVDSGERLRVLEGHTEGVTGVAFAPDGRMLASGSGAVARGVALSDIMSMPKGPGRVILWDAESGERLRTLEGHTKAVTSVAFAPGGEILASGSNDGMVILWDVTSGERLRTLEGHTGSVTSVAFAPGGEILASGSDDDTVILWEVGR